MASAKARPVPREWGRVLYADVADGDGSRGKTSNPLRIIRQDPRHPRTPLANQKRPDDAECRRARSGSRRRDAPQYPVVGPRHDRAHQDERARDHLAVVAGSTDEDQGHTDERVGSDDQEGAEDRQPCLR